MPQQRITYPTGRVETFDEKTCFTHAVVIKHRGQWSIWDGHTARQSAYAEASYLAAYARFENVTVVPVEVDHGQR